MLIKHYQSLYYISTQFLSSIPKTGAVRFNSGPWYLVHTVKMGAINRRISGAPGCNGGSVGLLPVTDT